MAASGFLLWFHPRILKHFFVTKNLDLEPDPDSPQILDTDLINRYGSKTLLCTCTVTLKQMFLICRKKDLVKLQYGEYVSLGKVESVLKVIIIPKGMLNVL